LQLTNNIPLQEQVKNTAITLQKALIEATQKHSKNNQTIRNSKTVVEHGNPSHAQTSKGLEMKS
jgi:hypothetical protein